MKSPHKNIISIIVAAIGILVAFVMFAPDGRIEAAKTAIRRVVNDPAQICLDARAPYLRDPKSAEMLYFSKTKDALTVTYRAVNGFGAYEQDSYSCSLIDGDLHEAVLEIQAATDAMKRALGER